MTQKELNELEEEIEKALDNLDYDLSYSIDSRFEKDYYSGGRYAIVEVEFDYDDMDDDTPDDWDDDVEDAISSVMNNWGGSCEWDDNSIVCSVDADN